MEINLYLIQHYKGDQLLGIYRIIAPNSIKALIVVAQLRFKAYGFLTFPLDLAPGLNSYHITHLKHFKSRRIDYAKRIQKQSDLENKYYKRTIALKSAKMMR